MQFLLESCERFFAQLWLVVAVVACGGGGGGL